MALTPRIEGYVILEKIGFGTYANVYKAFKKASPKEALAVKCIEKTKIKGSGVDNVITEITLLKKLKHEFIVEMKDFLWDDRFIYLIMEYCNGGDLSCFIRKRQKLPESVCRRFLQQLALALKFLRSHDICHMDLKPQNLLLVTNPHLTLKLGDFGFAQYLSPDTHQSSIRGSPLYMAPEMLLEQKYDFRVDLWSVGVILYECLFGKAPYSSGSLKELSEKIKNKTKIEIPSGSSISNECMDILTRLLQHDPDKRISYEEFFEHPFLDLKHYPSPETYQKAMELVQNAVKHDTEGDKNKALQLYCEALFYFIPLINAEKNVSKKKALRSSVDMYIKRAEELKHIIHGKSDLKSNDTKRVSSTDFQLLDLTELGQLCNSTPKLASAIEIACSAEQYLAEGQYKLALEKFQTALGVLVSMLPSEPKGRRRDLLHKQTRLWMKQAEDTKAMLEIVELNEAGSASLREQCLLQ